MNADLSLADFDFELPKERIAQSPLPRREDSKLLVVDPGADPGAGELLDQQFACLPDFLAPGDLLVLNDTRVIAARAFGYKSTGGAVEIMTERVLDERRMLALVRSSKGLRPGGVVRVGQDAELRCVARHGQFHELELLGAQTVDAFLAQYGETPLPPYIDRKPEPDDLERYQTVYARADGAVAAPTAGLHFSRESLGLLESRGVEVAYLTLHVGSGTFQPIRDDDIDSHRMHAERVVVTPSVCEQVARATARGNRVVCVGTTCVRALESAAMTGELEPFDNETRLFIKPGFEFRVVDALITNFHLPRSTLLLLVSALAGVDVIKRAYAHAIASDYRFFSYGDAMLITGRASG